MTDSVNKGRKETQFRVTKRFCG